MAMDTKDMMNEMGAAFAVTWLVMGYTVWTGEAMASETALVGIGMSGIMGVAALGVAWMAFAGAHILPPVTFMHMMTGELDDTDAWMANGLKLAMQIVGGLLALLMMAELNDNGVTYSESMGGEAMADWAFDGMTMAGGIAAGAVLWCIHSRTDNPWATAVGVIAMGSYIGASGSTDMASMLANEMGDLVPTLLDYIVTGVSVGLGALLATKIDEAMA
ncbi:MAG TPA: hypothetical protein HA240_03335 [Candidatus Thalassarchaeaceae archaeon]|nr:hypothetical protein [Euryarchaeota archaeon]MDC0502231.1 hypothetical protein [Euryarchaeota archaeon]MDC3326216.1 hypothetical protein [Euryarchaeota archaeon]DAC63254.1 MAG TPA: hypothetical protein D7I04_03310 [Candidatus Poseidoniales archaeon]HIH06263.1 hypothetical protein [Candidatus Thalassarchaeaceae archaeon]